MRRHKMLKRILFYKWWLRPFTICSLLQVECSNMSWHCRQWTWLWSLHVGGDDSAEQQSASRWSRPWWAWTPPWSQPHWPPSWSVRRQDAAQHGAAQTQPHCRQGVQGKNLIHTAGAAVLYCSIFSEISVSEGLCVKYFNCQPGFFIPSNIARALKQRILSITNLQLLSEQSIFPLYLSKVHALSVYSQIKISSCSHP